MSSPQAADHCGFNVLNKHVIPSQCAHWRGNLLDFFIFISDYW